MEFSADDRRHLACGYKGSQAIGFLLTNDWRCYKEGLLHLLLGISMLKGVGLANHAWREIADYPPGSILYNGMGGIQPLPAVEQEPIARLERAWRKRVRRCRRPAEHERKSEDLRSSDSDYTTHPSECRSCRCIGYYSRCNG